MDFTGIMGYLISFLVTAGIYAIFCLGLNIQWGYTGLFNVGIAGFFCVGAYISALITTARPTGEYANYVSQLFALNLPFGFGLVGAALVCGVIAFFIGMLTLKLKGDYLAIATIGIAETIRLLFLNESWLANGSRGLSGLPRPFEEVIPPMQYDYFYLVIVILIMALIYFLIEKSIRSPWGRVLRAIREDEVSASMSGKDVVSFKMQSFVFGAMIMGIGGALYAHYVKTVTPNMFTPLYGTFIFWVMIIAGGSGNNKGAILGAFVVWGVWILSKFVTDFALPYDLKARGPYIRFLVLGIMLLVILVKRPTGLLGEEKTVSRHIE